MSVTESQFYMWRALFAISHVDNVLSPEEIRFMTETLEDIPFSAGQKQVLKDDIINGKDIVEMFQKISNANDQASFFRFAMDLVWIDGDYGEDEQKIMLKLKQLHLQNVNVDDLIGNVGLELEDDYESEERVRNARENNGRDVRNILYSFREKFLKEKVGK